MDSLTFVETFRGRALRPAPEFFCAFALAGACLFAAEQDTAGGANGKTTPFDSVFRLASSRDLEYEKPVKVTHAVRDKEGNFYFRFEFEDRPYHENAMAAYPSSGGAPKWMFSDENLYLEDGAPAYDSRYLYVFTHRKGTGPNPVCARPLRSDNYYILSLKDGSIIRTFRPDIWGGCDKSWKAGKKIYSLAVLSPFVEDRYRMLHATSVRDGKRFWDVWTTIPGGHDEDSVINDPPEKIVAMQPMVDGQMAAFSKERRRIYAMTKFRYLIYVFGLNGKEKFRIGPGTKWNLPVIDWSQPVTESFPLIHDLYTLGGRYLVVRRWDENNNDTLDIWRQNGELVLGNIASPSFDKEGYISFSHGHSLFVLKPDAESGEYYTKFKIHEYRLDEKALKRLSR